MLLFMLFISSAEVPLNAVVCTCRIHGHGTLFVTNEPVSENTQVCNKTCFRHLSSLFLSVQCTDDGAFTAAGRFNALRCVSVFNQIIQVFFKFFTFTSLQIFKLVIPFV